MFWVFLAIAAAGFQTLRFILQKVLATGTLSAAGATYARFLYSTPFVVSLAIGSLWLSDIGMVLPSALFWAYALAGGLFQILATWAVVALFQRRAFAVGITFKKTEVVQAALVGFVVLGDVVTSVGMIAIALGFVGVIVLSARPEGAIRLKTLINPASGLGLLSGAFFALSAVAYRGAVLEIGLETAYLSAIVTLSLVTISQTLAVTVWLGLRAPGEIGRTIAAWRTAVWMGLSGMAGSICWFTAFGLQNAAYVFAVGQVEVVFSLAASILLFGEKLTRRELFGIGILTLSILVLVLAG